MNNGLYCLCELQSEWSRSPTGEPFHIMDNGLYCLCELQSERSQLPTGESLRIMNNGLYWLCPRWISPSLNFFCHLKIYIYIFIHTHWPYYEACWILVPWPGIKPMSPAGKPIVLTTWTIREFLDLTILRLPKKVSGLPVLKENRSTCLIFVSF